MKKDWGECSEIYDELKEKVKSNDITLENEAQTRFDVIDRVIKECLGWQHGQISVEERTSEKNRHYIDYILRCGDRIILIEAKKIGASFPNPTKKSKLKLSGALLSEGEIADAINQATNYANEKKIDKGESVDIIVVTNGLCWCYFSFPGLNDTSYASLLFPFDDVKQAEELFNVFSVWKVEQGSLDEVSNILPLPENRIITSMHILDGRIDRNNIADHILPALDHALYADAILKDRENLEKCFVSTDNRIKYDSLLKIHLGDTKPSIADTLKRIKKDKQSNEFNKIVESGLGTYLPPVTLIIGPVGVGKSTFLTHFKYISGKKTIEENKIHWVYIDFGQLGVGGNPREYLYNKLKDYLAEAHPNNEIDYTKTIEPAYQEVIEGLRKGPLAPIASDKTEFNKRIADLIQNDYEKTEPYIERVYKYLSRKSKCVVVLDNIDLYEKTDLEAAVFSEGLALSRKISANVIVSIRDKTFVKHRTDSTFDAYELRALWLDPPPFKEVLSRRLTYSKIILRDKSASITLPNGYKLVIPDLGNFFDIVQKSVLSGPAGDFVDCIADLNIRKGLSLITNFLTSGHIQADQAIKDYLAGNTGYKFPFHEVFKGAILGQWKHFREDRASCINLFDSRLGSRKLKLLRLWVLNFLNECASFQKTIEVPVKQCFDLFRDLGCTENHLVLVMNDLYKNSLIRNISATDIDIDSTVTLTRCGGYYVSILSKKFAYVEECAHDTSIDDNMFWKDINVLTQEIETATYVSSRMENRITRMNHFLSYLETIEQEQLKSEKLKNIQIMSRIREGVTKDMKNAKLKTDRYQKDKLINKFD